MNRIQPNSLPYTIAKQRLCDPKRHGDVPDEDGYTWVRLIDYEDPQNDNTHLIYKAGVDIVSGLVPDFTTRPNGMFYDREGLLALRLTPAEITHIVDVLEPKGMSLQRSGNPPAQKEAS
ncbi:MAG: hypothetical protein SFT92_01785 [Rickettsiales bacterium]|nr:hypothetical protein [Rickettsiales bacterium]